MDRYARDTTREILYVDGRAFGAAERLMNAEPGSPEANRAQGELLREATRATGRLLLHDARDARDALRSKDFWRGFSGR